VWFFGDVVWWWAEDERSALCVEAGFRFSKIGLEMAGCCFSGWKVPGGIEFIDFLLQMVLGARCSVEHEFKFGSRLPLQSELLDMFSVVEMPRFMHTYRQGLDVHLAT
jgi:hypothetical protein